MGLSPSDWRRPAVISGATDRGPPGHPDPKDRVEQGGGRLPPSVTPRKDKAGRLGAKEKSQDPWECKQCTARLNKITKQSQRFPFPLDEYLATHHR